MIFRTCSIAIALLLVACGSEFVQGQPSAPADSDNLAQGAAQADLRAAAEDSPAALIYEANGWQPVWTDAAENELREALGERARHGLDRLQFLDRSGGTPGDREIFLTEAALGYASTLAAGLVDPGDLYDVYTIPVPQPDLVPALAEAVANGTLREWLDGLAPQDERYAALSRAYLEYRERAQEGDGTEVGGGDLIREGDMDPRVPRIAEMLRQGGYLAQADGGPDAGQTDTLYTARLSNAVERMQAARGIAADGIVGPETIVALNISAADRARAAAVALERRRWLERNPPRTRVDVNTAATMLDYYRDGTSVDRRKVIAGQPGWETPQLQSAMYRLVANPTWTVPRSIEREELSHLGPAGLRERNMVRRDGWIVQLSGPDNALGLVKFDMANGYAIYLHDTGSKSLFDHNVRNLSHGCVRVHNALEFARMLARDQGITQEWQEARANGEQSFLPLPDNIPVRLLYHPTYVGPSGEVRFTQDIYGWNAAIGERLGFGGGTTVPFVPEVEDLGP